VDALGPGPLAALARVVEKRGGPRVRIEQPTMADVFRRLSAAGSPP